MFQNAVEQSDYVCCGITIGAFAGIMVAVFAAIIILAIVLACFLKKDDFEKGSSDDLRQAESERRFNDPYNSPPPAINPNYSHPPPMPPPHSAIYQDQPMYYPLPRSQSNIGNFSEKYKKSVA